jgi:hypothetical protein
MTSRHENEMTKTTSREIADEIADLVERLHMTPKEKKGRVENEIMSILFPHFNSWAPAFCRRSGDVSYQHRGDVVSVVAERVIEVLRESENPEKHQDVLNWYAYLYGVSQYAVLAYFNSASVTAATGMTSLMRRQRLLAHTREELRGALGREPEAQELLDAHNTKMRARRSNPEKQGAIVDMSDLDVVLPAADIADHDRAIAADDAVLSPVEGRDLVGHIVDVCYKLSPDLGEASRIWLGSVYSEPPVMGDEKDVARELGITRARAANLLAQAREHARDLCDRVYGINLSF